MRALWMSIALLLSLSACGRYFPTALRPVPQQGEGMEVNDDGSVTYNLGRLAVSVKPMTDAELNRQFAGASTGGAAALNPYTFGDWAEAGDDFTPPRFTVFRVQVNNYEFPKVRLDPLKMNITTSNNRQYPPLSYADLYGYYRAHWQGNTGRGRVEFRSRTDLLKQTLYSGATIFSGRDEEGYVVFPRLADDVKEIVVHIEEMAVRFDYADLPTETVNLSYAFERDVLRGFTPGDAVVSN